MLPDESAEMPPERLVELAVAAEEIGYGTAWLPDHLLPPAPFGATYGGVYEPLVSLAYIAARTTRIRLGTSVLVLPLRNPYAVAKQAATLHRLSGERLTLGVGAGWDAAEFAAVGVEFADRGKLTDEGLKILRNLFEGTHQSGVFEPKLQAPLPLMVGGTTPRALRRAAFLADEWQGLNLDGPGFTQAVERLRSYSDRPVRVGTRIHWSGDAPTLPAAVALAHELETAGAETLAISFGPHQNAEAKFHHFHHAVT